MESPDTLIIFYDISVGKEPLLRAIDEYNATIIYDLNIVKSITIIIPKDKHIEDAIDYFNSIDGVLQVNRDYIYQIDNLNY